MILKSSTVNRLLHGNLASGVSMVVNMCIQLVSAPVFLSYWGANQYGIWLLFNAMISVLQLFETGHHRFLGSEFLRIGTDRKSELENVGISGAVYSIGMGLLSLVFVLVLKFSGVWQSFINSDSKLFHEVFLLLVIHCILWTMFGSAGGILVRLMGALGYYSRFAWWGLLIQAGMVLAPLTAVCLGAGLLGAGISMLIGVAVFNILFWNDALRILSLHKFKLRKPDWSLGIRNLLRSQWLTFKAGSEIFRQQGMRILLGATIGPVELTTFATIRTGANVALKGLGTISGPLLPELMRFLNKSDQDKTEGGLSAIWIVLIFAMSPSAIFLQSFIEPVFDFWTRNKVPFDPLLFAVLSSCVMTFAMAQPAMAIAIGNNLLRPQVIISVVTAVIVLLLILVLLPISGIRGAGWALFIGEIFAAIGYIYTAQEWLSSCRMRWPWTSFVYVCMVVLTTLACIISLAVWPSVKFLLLCLSLFLILIFGVLYFLSLPPMVRKMFYSIILAGFSVSRLKS